MSDTSAATEVRAEPPARPPSMLAPVSRLRAENELCSVGLQDWFIRGTAFISGVATCRRFVVDLLKLTASLRAYQGMFDQPFRSELVKLSTRGASGRRAEGRRHISRQPACCVVREKRTKVSQRSRITLALPRL
jgi:hypothetical protein